MHKYTAIIPVRGGSRRLPNKNILPFDESNLLLHKIGQLQKVDAIQKIVVTSDSEIMLDMAKGSGCLTHYRSKEYADEKTRNFGEVVEHVVLAICDGETNVLWTPCVCPLIDESDYTSAIYHYQQQVLIEERFDSIVSCKNIQEYIWNQDGPINYSVGVEHVPSQQLPIWRVVINGFFIARCQDMIRWKYNFGNHPLMIPIPKNKSIDIDDYDDYLMAQFFWERLKNNQLPPPLYTLFKDQEGVKQCA